MSEKFYNTQSDITAAKIKIYKEYITGYLPKILQTFDRCLIADLFCGTGKNDDKDGSALTLIQQAEYILTSPLLKENPSKIEILFNDTDKNNIENLILHLEDFSHPCITIHPPTNSNFTEAIDEILETISAEIPKFFFLDPFTYSDVSLDNLANLMRLSNTEVFLFVPVFHSYRFANQTSYPKGHKTRIFVEEFTTKGMMNYQNIDDFMQSINQKIKQALHLDYVRPVLLDDGRCKNAIFLLTKHRVGMLLMNKIAFKHSKDGAGINIKQQQSKQIELLGTSGTMQFNAFSEKLEQELKNGKMTNEQIVDFTIAEGFLPKHVKTVLISLNDKNKIVVYDKHHIDITNKKGKWNIAEKINQSITFHYVN